MDGKTTIFVLFSSLIWTAMAARRSAVENRMERSDDLHVESLTGIGTLDRSDDLSVESSMGNGTQEWGFKHHPNFHLPDIEVGRRRRYIPAEAPQGWVEPAVPLSFDFCDTAECCKVKAKGAEDAKLCDEFYDHTVGVAWQMVRDDKWDWFAGLRDADQGPSPYKDNFESTRFENKYQQQCVSISHSGKTPCPYPGADSSWGLLSTVGETSDFWQYFEECSDGALTAQCHDGFKCGVGFRTPLPGSANRGWTYEKFTLAKNRVVEQTGTPQCPLEGPHHYNEFDTNGLSKNAVVGVFVAECLVLRDKEKPAVHTVCGALNNINPQKRNWPVYAYSYNGKGGSSSLSIQSYIAC